MGGTCSRACPDLGWLYRHSRARNAQKGPGICHVARLRKAGAVGHTVSPPAHVCQGLQYLSEKPVTCPGLPYSLWALSDASGWLGWVPWLVRLWGIQETRSLRAARDSSRDASPFV